MGKRICHRKTLRQTTMDTWHDRQKHTTKKKWITPEKKPRGTWLKGIQTDTNKGFLHENTVIQQCSHAVVYISHKHRLGQEILHQHSHNMQIHSDVGLHMLHKHVRMYTHTTRVHQWISSVVPLNELYKNMNTLDRHLSTKHFHNYTDTPANAVCIYVHTPSHTHTHPYTCWTRGGKVGTCSNTLPLYQKHAHTVP